MKTDIRFATPDDAALLLELIRDLATYEREPDAVLTTEAQLRDQLASERPPFESLIAEIEGNAVGFALYFESYSTWRGSAGIYLEDLFVRPERRGSGVGGALFRRVASIAKERGYPRLELAVLDWNRPAIEVYEHLGGRPQNEWTVYRFEDETLARLAARS